MRTNLSRLCVFKITYLVKNFDRQDELIQKESSKPSTDIFHRPCQENITKILLVQLWHGTYLMDLLLDQTAGMEVKRFDKT